MHLPAYLILCIFASSLALIRMYITGTIELSSFVWNLILAVLPYIFALSYVSTKGWKRYVSFFFWLFFLPNSFYILTDFVHLPRFPEMVFYDIVYISAMAFAGMVSGYASLELVHKEWNIHYHKKWGWMLVISTMMLSTVGVYIGRFLRFNSWDVLAHPLDLVREIATLIVTNGGVWDISDSYRQKVSELFVVGSMGLWQFVALYGSFFLIVYMYLYHSKNK